jgi:thiol-disulfide isomerase/thioredoxin
VTGREGLVLLGLCAVLAVAPVRGTLSAAPGDGSGSPGGEPAGTGVSWVADYELALEEALVTRRPVLLTFYVDWCGWCRKLEQGAFRDPRFVEMSRELIPVRVNGERVKGLASLFRVSGYPVTLVLSRQGRVLERITGYRPPGEFVNLVARALQRREPLAEAREAVRQRPEDPAAVYALGDRLLASGEYAEARAAFLRSADLSESGTGELAADARLDAALTCFLAGEDAEALPRFEDFLRRYPASDRRDQGLFFYGRALLNVGRIDEGRTQLDAAADATSLRYIRGEAERLLKRSLEEGQGG